MPRYEWHSRQFQNFNYDDLAALPAVSPSLSEWVTGVSLVKTLVWWDLRQLVAEDHTDMPRAPYPVVLDVYAAHNSESLPPTGHNEDPILTSMMGTQPSPAFGSILGTSEIQNRLWVGNSGAAPIESKAQRDGGASPGSWNLRCRLTGYNNTSSPTGAITSGGSLFLVMINCLFQLRF